MEQVATMDGRPYDMELDRTPLMLPSPPIQADSGMQQQIQEHFQTTNIIATLGVGLYDFGSIFGPLIGGPLSELYGRRPVYIGASVGFVCLIGSAVFTLYGGTLADMFSPDERGPLVALFTVVLQGAPTIGPVPSSLLGNIVHWRWLMGGIAAWAAIITVFLKRKSMQYGEELPGNKVWVYPLDVIPLNRWASWGKRFLPLSTTLYHAFIHGLLFLLLEAYPHVYKSHYPMSRQQASLVFIAPWLGNFLGVLIYFCIRVLEPQYEAHQHAILVQSVGMLWFALSARPDVYWLVPVLSGVPVGMGMTLLQLSLLNYYIDLYPTQSASVIAANCAFRNVVSTISPSLGIPLYTHFGTRNASLLLACISCIGFPTALILLLYGKKLRAASTGSGRNRTSLTSVIRFLISALLHRS
ncbi:major facilitator superfamily domain-containing protein [Boletus reticuloceps]|uniref:Major facilitator superfamily domain-containing protein n=1 Tax=Boletus reticuloceps TaxID=495285 RepID=A0A8I2YJQ0_9AGAM|nr:major facilitator superfamily domain-containing protein [Boletus reticuloceps]